MSWDGVFRLIVALFSSLGGGAVIIFAFSNWLGKVWAARILETERSNFQREIESFKNTLQKEIEEEKANFQREIEEAKAQYQLESEKNKIKFLRYSETQFKLYSDLWLALCKLEKTSEELWNSATFTLVLKLKKDLINAKKAIKEGYLLIEENHYEQLLNIVKEFERFQFGKLNLINLRKDDFNSGDINDDKIQQTIRRNTQVRDQYSYLFQLVGKALKKQINI